MRVNSLGPAFAAGATGTFAAGWFTLEGNCWSRDAMTPVAPVDALEGAGGTEGSWGVARDAKVRVQAPGSAPEGAMAGIASTGGGVGALVGESSIWISRVMPAPDPEGEFCTGCDSAIGGGENGSRLGAAVAAAPGGRP